MSEEQKKTIADQYRELLDVDPKMALELAIQQNLLASARLAESRDVTADESGQLVYRSLAGLEKIGQFYAASGQLPDHLANKPTACAVLCQLAMRLKVDPLSLMQKSYIVHGKPGVEAPFLIGMVNSSGKIKGRIQWDEKRDESGNVVSSTAWAIDAVTGDKLVGTPITWDLVCAWKWDQPKKDGPSMWVKMRDQMFRYRAAAFMIRAFFSDITLGLYTTDELREIDDSSSGSVAAPQSLLSTPVAPPAPIQTATPVAAETAKPVEREPEPAKEVATSPTAQELIDQTIRRGQEQAASKPDSMVVAPVEKKSEPASDAERLPEEAMKIVFGSIERVASLAGMRVKRQKYAEDGSLHQDDLQLILDKCDARISTLDKKPNGFTSQKSPS